ncbi:hypothetical protein GLOTRDRAFT_140080 [Gloeophyllum trabeum ATCC 11539]|uniref:Alanine dehydrogenase/pyridine nucleotide transhydrogenase N-terminal domain-containing protein n=1 Tax=Gloeophyllum trabeum (strain ATCC 11539 / FP-39264 / Madison 617) TaxID=670483 RepID=S7Q0Y0_GLOTA|nr:uncharacterized protein GLOTRDRAFT_140080 [Gloeophyllum trabeum ATCC 11539]EPQ53172.1 hypothetical protein GLOTRDRAFT_140080 [Gloeophyllum trabeum ATCC 11539]
MRSRPLVLARRRLLCRSNHHLANPKPVTIGIRREDSERIWERRCPLTPDAVHELVKDGVNVLVQDCSRRVYRSDEFVKAGAQIHPNLSPAHIILGIKETPLAELLTTPVDGIPRTHLMFSHTIKGQLYNMPLLDRFLEARPGSGERKELLPRLIDWELLTDEKGKRTVGFGWFAGVAGVLESLSMLAQFHLELGIASPFLYTPRPHMHPDLPSIRASLSRVGEMIKEGGTPREVGPIIIGVTGTGKVAQGMLDILSDLPIEKVNVEDLPRLVGSPEANLHKIYLVHALPHEYFSGVDGRPYNREDYYANPHLYKSNFHVKVQPYLTLLLHGAGWAQGFPRVMTNEGLATSLEIARGLWGGEKGRGRCVGDVSCDVEGGLEFLPRHSTLSAPFFCTRPGSLPAHLPEVRMMAVDILPSSLPLDASRHFSQGIMSYLRTLIRGYRGEGGVDAELERALDRATVTRGGELQGSNTWLKEPLGVWKDSLSATPSSSNMGSTAGTPQLKPSPKKRVLLLGSGMVAGPVVEHIGKRGEVELVVASNILAEAQNLAKRFGNAKPVSLDVADLGKLGSLIEETDVVISLLPVTFHPTIAEQCIKHKKHMVTASYISPAMKQLHDSALSSDTLILNEIGLDPGIDHCSAFSLLGAIRSQGKQVRSFVSFCGGLPAPECAEDGPLGYKFSWSPLGVLRAAKASARFKLNNRHYEIDEPNLLRHHFDRVPISNVLQLEGIANRDSIPYADTYGLGKTEDLRSILRGTLRYPGFCDLMQSFKEIGLLEFEPKLRLDSWSSLVRSAFESRYNDRVKGDDASLISALSNVLSTGSVERALEALSWFGVIPGVTSPVVGMPLLPQREMAPIELFATVLAHKQAYRPGERDMVILHHEIVASASTPASPEDIHTSTLMAYGTPVHSAMALTVGLPVAFAALRVLDGKVAMRGVRGPEEEGLWRDVLQGMEEAGLGMRESVRAGGSGRAMGMEGVLDAGLRRSMGAA